MLLDLRSCKSLLNRFKSLVLRTHLSAQHEQMWVKLEDTIFFYRSTVTMALLVANDCYDFLVWRGASF